ncbi:MAG: TRAP transporter substrate-binding protein [Alphaproteobacteria bacterium]|jgi:TRAP-type C4-dicarboxylate transport system substrate-binding protein|nr:TRAP transporter substrate-binding protein [Alphaproteobacteria bacterium]
MAEFDIKFSGYQGPRSVHNRAVQVFGESLAESLGERVAFDHVLNVIEQGSKAADLLEMVATGETSLCYFSSSYLADKVPEIALFDLPFLIRDRAQAYAMMDGPLGELIVDKMAEAADFRIVAWWDNGFRHFSNGVRPIRKPADCKGLKIRTLFSALQQESLAAMGFEPVPLDVAQLPGACADGSVDAQENPLTNTFNFGIDAFHRWITMSGHFFGPCVVLAHKDTWDSWPQDVRQAVQEALALATPAQRSFAASEDAELMVKLDPSRNELLELSVDERAAFVAAVQPLVAMTMGQFHDELFEYLPRS